MLARARPEPGVKSPSAVRARGSNPGPDPSPPKKPPCSVGLEISGKPEPVLCSIRNLSTSQRCSVCVFRDLSRRRCSEIGFTSVSSSCNRKRRQHPYNARLADMSATIHFVCLVKIYYLSLRNNIGCCSSRACSQHHTAVRSVYHRRKIHIRSACVFDGFVITKVRHSPVIYKTYVIKTSFLFLSNRPSLVK